MSANRIVCTDRSEKITGHNHIVSVGMGTDNTKKATKKWTVTEVRTALKNGDTFYTVSASTDKKAYVEPYDCICGVKTLRTNADNITDDNLDDLRHCNWKS